VKVEHQPVSFWKLREFPAEQIGDAFAGQGFQGARGFGVFSGLFAISSWKVLYVQHGDGHGLAIARLLFLSGAAGQPIVGAQLVENRTADANPGVTGKSVLIAAAATDDGVDESESSGAK
jgi:hypothetical protein